MSIYLHLDYDPTTDTTLATSVTPHPPTPETMWRRAYLVRLEDVETAEIVAEEVHESPHLAAWAVARFTGASVYPDLLGLEREGGAP